MKRLLSNDKGIALGYVYGLIALLAILGVMLAQDSGVKQTAISQKRMTDGLVAQANLIRNALFLCKIGYPAGGATGGTDNSLPADTATLATATCPGSPSGALVFGGVSDVMYPPPIPGFDDWSLTNDGTGVSIAITQTTAGETHSGVAMQSAVKQLGSWQASISGSTLTYQIKQ